MSTSSLPIDDTLGTIEKLIQCPICNEVPQSPILLCENGHTVCGKCRRRIQICPVCNGSLTTTRNIFAEQLLENLTRPCKYAKEGCTIVMKVGRTAAHYERCSYRPFLCHFEANQICPSVSVNFTNFIGHLTRVHGLQLHAGSPFDCIQSIAVITASLDMDVPWGNWALFGTEVHNATFIVATAIKSKKIFWWVYHVGPAHLYSKYSATICLYRKFKGKGNSMELSYHGQVHSIRKLATEVMAEGYCLVATQDNFENFCKTKQSVGVGEPAEASDRREWSIRVTVDQKKAAGSSTTPVLDLTPPQTFRDTFDHLML